VPGKVDIWLGGGQPVASSDVSSNGQHVQLEVSGRATLAD